VTATIDLPPGFDAAALREAVERYPGEEEVVVRVGGEVVETVRLSSEIAADLVRTCAVRSRGCLVVGIDPGLDGAVAALTADGTPVGVRDTPTIQVRPKSSTREYLPAEMKATLARLAGDGVHVGIEAVSAAPIQGRRQGTSSMFSFGRGLGLWEGIVAGMALPSSMVRPADWKRTAGIPAGSKKEASIPRAGALFPSMAAHLTLVKHHNRADALLIAHHVRTRVLSSGGA